MRTLDKILTQDLKAQKDIQLTSEQRAEMVRVAADVVNKNKDLVKSDPEALAELIKDAIMADKATHSILWDAAKQEAGIAWSALSDEYVEGKIKGRLQPAIKDMVMANQKELTEAFAAEAKQNQDFKSRLDAEVKRYKANQIKAGATEAEAALVGDMKRDDVMDAYRKEEALKALQRENDIAEGKIKLPPLDPKVKSKLSLADDGPDASVKNALDVELKRFEKNRKKYVAIRKAHGENIKLLESEDETRKQLDRLRETILKSPDRIELINDLSRQNDQLEAYIREHDPAVTAVTSPGPENAANIPDFTGIDNRLKKLNLREPSAENNQPTNPLEALQQQIRNIPQPPARGGIAK